MRILHIGKYYSPFEGGIENFLAGFLKASSADGIEHFVLAHHHLSGKKSVKELRDETQLLRSFTLCKILFAPISPFFYRQLKEVIAEFKPDIIHVHMPNLSAFWLLLLGSSLSIPVIVHWHSDIVPSRKNPLLSIAYYFYEKMERRLLAKSSAIIATSKQYLDTSIPLSQWKEKCHVIPLGIDISNNISASSNTKTIWPSHDKFKVLCIGRLTYYKGHHHLLKAINNLPQAQLILIGTGKLLKKYRRVIDKYKLQDRVLLNGHATQSQIETLLKSCDCLCLPSIERTEAFGLVLLEAMAEGKPCLCTSVTGSGMSWVVQDEKTGLVTHPECSKSLENAIHRLSTNTIWAERLGQAGKVRLKRHFDIQVIAKKITTLYNDQSNPIEFK